MARPVQEKTVGPRELCRCGSGLRALRCCAMNPAEVTQPEANATLQPLIEKANAAIGTGDTQAAEQHALEILELAPGCLPALGILAQIRKQEGTLSATEALLRRLVGLDPNNHPATCDLAQLLLMRHALMEAEAHARNAVRIAPKHPQSHNLMGMIMTEIGRPRIGEYHYRQVMSLKEPDPIIHANLAWNLKNQGRIAEAREHYETSLAGNDKIVQTFLGYAKTEETDRNLEKAKALLDKANALAPDDPNILLNRAVIAGREQLYESALVHLDKIEKSRDEIGLGPEETLEKGRLLDKMGRHNQAFEAFVEGKRKYREMSGMAYNAEAAEQQVSRLKRFFTRSRLEFTPRGTLREDIAQPLFVTGFMRSGTTMIEQTLTAHSKVSAGDELQYINEISNIMPRMLASPLTYPECLADLWLGDQLEGLDNMRDYYLQRVRQEGIIEEGTDWFTDKMPLNETHLGLITLMFPDSPVIRVVRHPLDVILSVLSNHMTHGYFCSYSLESAARHFVLVEGLVDQYKAELDMKYLEIRYEDVVADQEPNVRKLLDFAGLEFEEACLKFHENRRYARTASYAQVTEELYDSSVNRYQLYLKELEPVFSILEPVIENLGYKIEA